MIHSVHQKALASAYATAMSCSWKNTGCKEAVEQAIDQYLKVWSEYSAEPKVMKQPISNDTQNLITKLELILQEHDSFDSMESRWALQTIHELKNLIEHINRMNAYAQTQRSLCDLEQQFFAGQERVMINKKPKG